MTAEMWNRVYENAEHIQYPETLKSVLTSLGSSVDVVRPGLVILDEDTDLHLKFAESQEDASLPVFSLPIPEPTPRPRRSTRRSATPASAKMAGIVRSSANTTPLARVKSKGRTPKPKLRHEDSQIQFAAIESSPAVNAQESQLLTDRQKEIRERQRGQAALYPELRSSPSAATKKAKSMVEHQELPSVIPGPQRATTPERNDGLEDYLTSTPTPRRGQPVMLPEQDQEMADPPSSPPEPRGYRLLSELRSLASNLTSLDEWQISSSPVLGSPNPAQQTISASQRMDLDDVDEELRLDEGEDVVNEQDVVEDVLEQNDVTSSQFAVDPEVIEETNIFDSAEEAVVPADVLTDLPMNQSLDNLVNPTSDKEDFVDAPTSPLPPMPTQRAARPSPPRLVMRRSSRNKGNTQSFSVSDSFEDGMRDIGTGRIEIDIRSSPKKKDVPSYDDILPESPEQAEEQTQAVKGAVANACIMVEGGESKKPRRGRSANKTRRPSTGNSSQRSQDSQGSQDRPSTPITQLAEQESFENVSPGRGVWLRKRKRSFSVQGGGKKQRHQEDLGEASQDEIPDSQPAAAASQGISPLSLRTLCYRLQVLIISLRSSW